MNEYQRQWLVESAGAASDEIDRLTARLTVLEDRLARIHEYFAWQARDGDWYGMTLDGEEVARLAALSAALASEGP